MASPSDRFLTNTNYFSWKSHMEDLLKSKELYRITLGKEQEPTDDDKYAKWINMNNEARGLIEVSIYSNLRFHLKEINAPNKAWEKIEVCLVNTILFKIASWKIN